MKVLLISSVGLDINGVSDFIYQFVKNSKGKIEISILSNLPTSEEELERFINLGITVYRIECRKSNPLKYMFKLLSLLRKDKFDIIHTNGSSSTLLFELLPAWFAGVKVRIAHSHNTTSQYQTLHNFLKFPFSKLYTHALSCGKEAGKWLFGSERFTVIPNGRDVEKFRFNKIKREKFREQNNLKEQDILIGHVGLFNEQKNQKFIIDIFDLLKKDTNYYLVLVGDGAKFEFIKEYANSKNLNSRIIYTGLVKNVEDIISACDLMILPSLYEGLPLVAVEWQINGCKSLISDRVTTDCKLTDLVRFLPIDNPEVWKNEILSINYDYRDSQDSKKYIEEIVNKNYDIDSTVENLLEFYYKAVNK